MNYYRYLKGIILTFLIPVISVSCSEKVESELPGNTFENAAVVSAHPLATNVGVSIMKNGGNAFDAAIAVQFTLAVVYPRAGNIGGGGFAVLVDAEGKSNTLDFREKAPILSDRNMYLDSALAVIPDLSTKGALAAAVPGTIMGMWDLHKKYGQKPWTELIQPAIDIASNGWELTQKEAETLSKYRDEILEVSKVNNYLTLQSTYQEGDSLKNENLAEVLKAIRDKGAEGFYNGFVADAIVSTMVKNRGIISKEDLQNYEAKWREPITGKFLEYDIISMPPPSSGGWALISLLKMTEEFPFKKWGRWNKNTIHAMLEMEKRVYADRASYLGDPDFYPIPMNDLLEEDYLKNRAGEINLDKALPADSIKAGLAVMEESTETTHYSIVDQEGNAIAVTTTLNGNFGSKLVVEGAGFLLNNEMDDFSAKPGYPNLYGLVGGEANAIEPGKRMLSSMTPAIVRKGENIKLIIGSPGGARIITSVYQNILNVLLFDYDMQNSVELPRIHHQWLPDSIYYEEDIFNYLDSLSLVKLGYIYKKNAGKIGRVDAILLNEEAKWECGADPRGDDFANGF